MRIRDVVSIHLSACFIVETTHRILAKLCVCGLYQK